MKRSKRFFVTVMVMVFAVTSFATQLFLPDGQANAVEIEAIYTIEIGDVFDPVITLKDGKTYNDTYKQNDMFKFLDYDATDDMYDITDDDKLVLINVNVRDRVKVTLTEPDGTINYEFLGSKTPDTLDAYELDKVGAYIVTYAVADAAGNETVLMYWFVVTANAHKHSYDGGVVTPPTCTADGFTTYTCGECEYSYKDNIVPKGHSYGVGVVTPPNYTADGFTTYTCECGHSYTDNIVPKLTYTISASTDSNIAADFFNGYVLGAALKTPEREGYTFEGWYTDAACTNKIASVSASNLNSDGKLTLYAKWGKDGLGGGAIAGIVIGSAVVLGAVGFLLYWFVFRKKKV